MVPLAALWLPILAAAILVFAVSSIVHMVLPYHRTDWRKVPAEDDVMEALRRFKIPPGDYLMPCPDSAQRMNSPEFVAKRDKGPVLLMTTWKPESSSMGKSLAMWFVYAVVVSIFAAYVTGLAVGPGAPYLTVFRISGTVAFAAYALALVQHSIWYQRAWSTTLKSMFDGLIYGLVTRSEEHTSEL